MSSDDDDIMPKQPTKKLNEGFSEDLKPFFIAFANDTEPRDESVKVLEEHLLFFLDKLMERVKENSSQKEGGVVRIGKEEIIYTVRNDAKWLGRIATAIKHCITIKEIKDAKKKDVNINKTQLF